MMWKSDFCVRTDVKTERNLFPIVLSATSVHLHRFCSLYPGVDMSYIRTTGNYKYNTYSAIYTRALERKCQSTFGVNDVDKHKYITTLFCICRQFRAGKFKGWTAWFVVPSGVKSSSPKDASCFLQTILRISTTKSNYQ